MKIVITLTKPELRALLTLAGEGFTGLANDRAAAKAYLDGPKGVAAGSDAIRKLAEALHKPKC